MVSVAGETIATRMCFGRCTRWLEKCATSIQNGVDSFVSTIPFTAVVRYKFSNLRRDSTDMSPLVSVFTGIKH